MRLRRHRAGEAEGESSIDLAPMLDFVMNLLIFFIITAVFVKEVGFSLSRPAASNQSTPQEQKKESKTLYIVLHNGGEISIDKRPIDVRAVRANVERFKAENPEGPVIVVANSQSATGVLVQVMDQVRMGGVFNVSIASTGGG